LVPFLPLAPLSGRRAVFAVTALVAAAASFSFPAAGGEEQQPLSPTITFAPDEWNWSNRVRQGYLGGSVVWRFGRQGESEQQA
jgi:hypothetical protein